MKRIIGTVSALAVAVLATAVGLSVYLAALMGRFIEEDPIE